MHKWTKNKTIYQYTLYKQYIKCKNIWFPNYKFKINNKHIIINTFKNIRNIKQLRSILIKKQHEKLVQTFNEYYSFKLLKYHTNNYQNFPNINLMSYNIT